MTTRAIVWDREFGLDYKPEDAILRLVEQGLAEDDSYGNDVAPSFTRYDQQVVLWAHPADPAKREVVGDAGNPRYQVFRMSKDLTYPSYVLYEGESTEEAIAAFLSIKRAKLEISDNGPDFQAWTREHGITYRLLGECFNGWTAEFLGTRWALEAMGRAWWGDSWDDYKNAIEV
jgi:hypothetical protein